MLIFNLFKRIDCSTASDFTLSTDYTYGFIVMEEDMVELRCTKIDDSNAPHNLSINLFADGLNSFKHESLHLKKECVLKRGAIIYSVDNFQGFYLLKEDTCVTLKNTNVILSSKRNDALGFTYPFKMNYKIKSAAEELVWRKSKGFTCFYKNEYDTCAEINDNLIKTDKNQKKDEFFTMMKTKKAVFESKGPFKLKNVTGLKKLNDIEGYELINTEDLMKLYENKTTSFKMDLYLCCGVGCFQIDKPHKVRKLNENELISLAKEKYNSAYKNVQKVIETVEIFLTKRMEEKEFKEFILLFKRYQYIDKHQSFYAYAQKGYLLSLLSSKLKIYYGFVMDTYAQEFDYVLGKYNWSFVNFGALDIEKGFIEILQQIDENRCFDHINIMLYENILLFFETVFARKHFGDIHPTQEQEAKLMNLKRAYLSKLDECIKIKKAKNILHTKEILNRLKSITEGFSDLLSKMEEMSENDFKKGEDLKVELDIEITKYRKLKQFCPEITKQLLFIFKKRYMFMKEVKKKNPYQTAIDLFLLKAKNKMEEISKSIGKETDTALLRYLEVDCFKIRRYLENSKAKLKHDDKEILKELQETIKNLNAYINDFISNLEKDARAKIDEINTNIQNKDEINIVKLVDLEREAMEIFTDLENTKNINPSEDVIIRELYKKINALVDHIDILKIALINDAKEKMREIEMMLERKNTDSEQLGLLKTECRGILAMLEVNKKSLGIKNINLVETMSKKIKTLVDYINDLIPNLVNNANTKMSEIKKVIEENVTPKGILKMLKSECKAILMELEKNKDCLGEENKNIVKEMESKLRELNKHMKHVDKITKSKHNLNKSKKSSPAPEKYNTGSTEINTKFKTWAIVGIVLGSLAGVVAITIQIWMFYKKMALMKKLEMGQKQ